MNNKISNRITRLRFITFLSPLVLVTALMVDMYVPALPQISRDLHSNEYIIQFTISIYLIFFAISQLFYGIASDFCGRKSILLLGLFILIVGTIICCFSTNIETLYIGRILQGFGAGAGVTITRAMGRDLFDTKELVWVMSWINLIYALGPALAPALGGYLNDSFGWQAIFVFATIFIIVVAINIYFGISETNLMRNQIEFNPSSLIKHHSGIINNLKFSSNLISAGAAQSGFFIYFTVTPFLFENALKLSASQYGFTAVILGVASVISRLFYNFFCFNMRPIDANLLGSGILMFGGTLMAAFNMFGITNLYAILLPMATFVFGAGFIFTCTTADALAPFKQRAGAASALYGFLLMAIAGVMTGLISWMQVQNSGILGLILICLGVVSLLVQVNLKLQERKRMSMVSNPNLSKAWD